jgi:hypothetical protein
MVIFYTSYPSIYRQFQLYHFHKAKGSPEELPQQKKKEKNIMTFIRSHWRNEM